MYSNKRLCKLWILPKILQKSANNLRTSGHFTLDNSFSPIFLFEKPLKKNVFKSFCYFILLVSHNLISIISMILF